MANLKKWIEEFMKDNKLSWKDIEAIHLGDKGWSYNESEEAEIISINKAKKKLDYEFDDGYGGENSHAFYIYFKKWILLKQGYDGAECLISIPRNPNPKVRPESIGGG